MTQKVLIDHIRKYLSISDEEISEIVPFFDSHSFKKKETLLFAEKRCDRLYFVSKGCLQLYFIDDLGNQKTTQFALEG